MTEPTAPTPTPTPAPATPGNVPELSVSELSRALKRTVEDAFSYVRVRGEISGFKRAASGHLYMTMKDTDAVLDAVCWRGTAGRLSVKPEDGLEVIATGRLTTYPGRSKYQIVIDSLELAGEGALLKLLEDRRKALAAEGLFDEARKRPLPYLPDVIGVVTSPTGAVIRDILHRLRDRFPRHVLVWPVVVQGEAAAGQVADAIAGFNALKPGGSPGGSAGGAVPRPDVLIVARGGGSLEDLWAFNEEVVVRAAAASAIPLISAVGHETDTTLIDFAADRRAPTPSAAAEMAVPVRSDLLGDLMDRERRLVGAVHRGVTDRARALEGLARGLPKPAQILDAATQRLDDGAERLGEAMPRALRHRARELEQTAARLRTPTQVIRHGERQLADAAQRLAQGARAAIDRRGERFADRRLGARLDRAAGAAIGEGADRLERAGAMLESLSYARVLERGYAVVRRADDGTLVADGAALTAGEGIEIEFARDTRRHALVSGDGRGSSTKSKPKAAAKRPPGVAAKQGDLF
ncbi:exodeoxyribonuclease VII large subunit [Marivibrio halodurans]|uniref:Exodeoxyribonuclease 7 large subunit n=1 Tax=Marivibrio halodurans TaxID=2039722 RepID=A0A8J7SPX5_9PROT|nr:exodeoxyribonuclease VII large subunit [Marivibrio halodurans]MBP5858903.1 exodeoxyribonuclease VII large subunit [Marivibrio halodurans]